MSRSVGDIQKALHIWFKPLLVFKYAHGTLWNKRNMGGNYFQSKKILHVQWKAGPTLAGSLKPVSSSLLGSLTSYLALNSAKLLSKSRQHNWSSLWSQWIIEAPTSNATGHLPKPCIHLNGYPQISLRP